MCSWDIPLYYAFSWEDLFNLLLDFYFWWAPLSSEGHRQVDSAGGLCTLQIEIKFDPFKWYLSGNSLGWRGVISIVELGTWISYILSNRSSLYSTWTRLKASSRAMCSISKGSISTRSSTNNTNSTNSIAIRYTFNPSMQLNNGCSCTQAHFSQRREKLPIISRRKLECQFPPKKKRRTLVGVILIPIPKTTSWIHVSWSVEYSTLSHLHSYL